MEIAISIIADVLLLGIFMLFATESLKIFTKHEIESLKKEIADSLFRTIEDTILDGWYLPLGSLVIVRSNEYDAPRYDPLQKAMIVGYMKGKSTSAVPLIRLMKSNGEFEEVPFVCFAIVVPYSDDLWKFLQKLSGKDQYEYLGAITRGDVTRKYTTEKSHG